MLKLCLLKNQQTVALTNCLFSLNTAGMILGAKFRSWAKFPWFFQK